MLVRIKILHPAKLSGFTTVITDSKIQQLQPQNHSLCNFVLLIPKNC